LGARFAGREGSREAGGVVMGGYVVQVAHRGLNVCVTHPALDAGKVDPLGGALRAERVPQVVKHNRIILGPQIAQAGGVEGLITNAYEHLFVYYLHGSPPPSPWSSLYGLRGVWEAEAGRNGWEAGAVSSVQRDG